MEPVLLRQGDVLLVPVEEVPAAASPLPRENGRLILAHGEVTGHAHAIVDESAELVSAEGAAELYLIVHGSEPVALTHEEHGTIMVPPGRYERRMQREYSEEGNTQVQD